MSRRTVAIIQARMGSTRLPGKVLMKLGRFSLLGFLAARLKSAVMLDGIVVATTRLPQDDVIVEESVALGLEFHRGSEQDVLTRYVKAAAAFDAEVVVRVTADNPLTDPDSIDRVVTRIHHGFDYSIEDGLPVGVTGEAVSLEALRFLDIAAKTPRYREHVTLYAKENPQLFRCARYPAPLDCARPELSFTVDTGVDYERIKDLCGRIPYPQFPLKDVITVADNAVVAV